MEKSATKLTPMQLELLKLFAHNPSEDELRDIKRLIAAYYAMKASDGMDKLWEERGYTEETVKEWLGTKMRSSKKSETP